MMFRFTSLVPPAKDFGDHDQYFLVFLLSSQEGLGHTFAVGGIS